MLSLPVDPPPHQPSWINEWCDSFNNPDPNWLFGVGCFMEDVLTNFGLPPELSGERRRDHPIIQRYIELCERYPHEVREVLDSVVNSSQWGYVCPADDEIDLLRSVRKHYSDNEDFHCYSVAMCHHRLGNHEGWRIFAYGHSVVHRFPRP